MCHADFAVSAMKFSLASHNRMEQGQKLCHGDEYRVASFLFEDVIIERYKGPPLRRSQIMGQKRVAFENRGWEGQFLHKVGRIWFAMNGFCPKGRVEKKERNSYGKKKTKIHHFFQKEFSLMHIKVSFTAEIDASATLCEMEHLIQEVG